MIPNTQEQESKRYIPDDFQASMLGNAFRNAQEFRTNGLFRRLLDELKIDENATVPAVPAVLLTTMIGAIFVLKDNFPGLEDECIAASMASNKIMFDEAGRVKLVGDERC